MNEITTIIIISGIASFFLLLISKWGIPDKVYRYEHTPKLIQELVRCDFCMCFWSCLMISLFFNIGYSIDGVIDHILIVFISTVFTRKLIQR